MENLITEEQREALEELKDELQRAIRYYGAMLAAIEAGEYSPKDAITDYEQLTFTEGLSPMSALERYATGDEGYSIE